MIIRAIPEKAKRHDPRHRWCRKELWSSRPCSGIPTSKYVKRRCHKIERRMSARWILEQLDD